MLSSIRPALSPRQFGGMMLAAPVALAMPAKASAAEKPMPKALFYDVFGTVMDWRTGVAKESERVLGPHGYRFDWLKFADDWRSLYQPSMEEVRSGRRPFTKLDVLHREMLTKTLAKYEVTGLSEAEQADMNNAWHRLDAWSDVQQGLFRLSHKFLLAPCSNGDISIMADLARRNNIRWDAILGSDIARDFKPKPNVYLAACAAFNLRPAECMMCAAHSRDLAAAAETGLLTAHIARPNEFGPNTGEAGPTVPVDYTTKSMLDLADQLGAV